MIRFISRFMIRFWGYFNDAPDGEAFGEGGVSWVR